MQRTAWFGAKPMGDFRTQIRGLNSIPTTGVRERRCVDNLHPYLLDSSSGLFSFLDDDDILSGPTNAFTSPIDHRREREREREFAKEKTEKGCEFGGFFFIQVLRSELEENGFKQDRYVPCSL